MTSYYTSAATTSSSADTSGYTADTSFSSGESSGGWQVALDSYQEFMDPTLYFTLEVTAQSGHGWTLYDGTNDVYDMNVVSYTIEGTDYALATYLDTMSNTAYAYVLYYANSNPYQISYEIADTSAITAIYYNENGDVIIKTVGTDNSADYTTITSGYDYNFAPVLTAGLSGAINSNGVYAIDPASLGTDADGDTLLIASYSADTSNIAMAVDSSGNLFAIYTGTLAQGANALVTISYALSDGTNTTTGGSIAVTVTGNGSGNLELTYDQYVALAAAGYDSTDFDAAFDQITVSCTAAEFDAEIGLNPQTASSFGLTDVTISDGASVNMSFYAGIFLATHDVTIAGASAVNVELAAEDVTGFETEDANASTYFGTLFSYFAALGVTHLVLADGSDIQLSLAPYTALADNGIAISTTGTVTLADDAADVAGLTSSDVANLAAVGVGRIDTTDDNLALSAGLAAKLAAAGLVFAEADTVSVTGSLAAVNALIVASGDAIAALNIDALNVEDLATNIKALSLAEIAALGDAGVTEIDLLDDAATLAASQIAAFTAAGIDFAADDVITEKAVPVAVADSATADQHKTATVSVLANDTAADGYTLSVDDATVTSSNGTATLNAQGALVVSYTGADIDRGETAAVVVSYTIDDGYDSATGTLTVTFNGVNEDGDILRGTSGTDTLRGTGIKDVILGLAGGDFLYGNGGNDRLDGGAGKDVLVGGAGADILIGGAGNDVLSGGAGADTFLFGKTSGHDTITDFAHGTDRIDLSAVTAITDFKDLRLHHVVDHGSSIEIVWGNHSVLLNGINDISKLSGSDFLFG